MSLEEGVKAAAERLFGPGAEVTELTSEPALGKGENYASVMTRVKVTVSLPSGPTTVSLIVKSSPEGDKVNDLFNECISPFETETKMYSEILPVTEKILAELKDNDSQLYADCYHFTPYSQLIFQDLTEAGFAGLDRIKGLSVDEAVMTVRGLARLHAAGVVAEERGAIPLQTMLRTYFVTGDMPGINSFYSGNMVILSEVMRDHWGPPWSSMAEKVLKFSKDFGQVLKKLREEDPELYKVLNHGDAWINNTLFKHDRQGKPTAIKFVDFQISHWGSFAWDLTMLFYISPKADLRHEHYDMLLGAYREALDGTLRALGANRPCPSLEDIHQEMDRLLYLGAFYTLSDLPLICTPSELSVDVEQLFDTQGPMREHKIKIYTQQQVKEIVQTHLKLFIDKNII